MSLFICIILGVPLALGLLALKLKKNSSLFSYMLICTIVYGILTILSIAFLRNILFHAQSFVLFDLVYINHINAIFIVLIMSLSFVISLYAIGYLRQEVQHKAIGYSRLRQYSLLINMFIFSMLFALLSNNLIITWIGLEATTVFTTFLISFYNTETSREAAWKYIIICSVGLTIGLFGLFLMLYSGLPSLNLSQLLTVGIDVSKVNILLLQFSFLFVIIGFGTKAALFPTNTWLPDAHGKAPSPVSAFMSSILLPLALYVIFRVKEILDMIIPGYASQVFLIFGIITLLFSSIILIRQNHFKRALAYSSSEHMGIIAIAIALNAPVIAFVHIIFHGFIKAASFMSAGNVLLELRSGQFAKIRKLFSYMKFTPILLIIALIFLMGVPPSYLFVTEIALIIKSFTYSPLIAMVVTGAILLATSGLLINFSKMFRGDDEGHPEHVLAKVENDFHRNSRHRAIALSLLFPLIFVVIACIGYGIIG